MGFFKKFLSLGSRKSKKNKQKDKSGISQAVPRQVDAEGRIVKEDHDVDNDANRLLRSVSARFAVATDTNDLPPPLPQLAITPKASSSQSIHSMSRNNTYIVRVHSRTLHSRTEFPNANPRLSNHDHELDDPRTPGGSHRPLKDILFTPRDESRLHALRRDPSVASLLNMYDDKGRLDANAFSNTPPTPAPVLDAEEGRAQVKRSGSTLRQLLGNPDSQGNATEGDISWAERFLGETNSAASSTSSLPLDTPDDADVSFSHDLSPPEPQGLTTYGSSFHQSHDLSMSAPYPLISSMEVEYSAINETSGAVSIVEPLADTLAIDPKTPQRAAEVFGFLTDRRRSLRVTDGKSSLPVHLLTRATEGHDPSRLAGPSIALPTSIDDSYFQGPSHISHAEVRTATLMKLSSVSATLTNNGHPLLLSADGTEGHELNISPRPSSTMHKGLTRQTTKSTISAPRDKEVCTISHAITTAQASRSKIPRGPRPRCTRSSNPSQTDLPSDLRTYISTPVARDVTTSRSSLGFGTTSALATKPVPHNPALPLSDHVEDSAIHGATATQKVPRTAKSSVKPARRGGEDKENGVEISPKANPQDSKFNSNSTSVIPNPATPPRSRTIFDIRYPKISGQVGDTNVPSPASSSELSPVAKDMMSNLRKQRMRAREAETKRRFGRDIRMAS
ncbi:uncharacterized protein FIBRA_00605 [Fibroporia radiculosa]|uniref:Uncharacterized protein n=1 Tax=Fibroporia radiculosa TaxID=599839 RepID=J4G0H1_9APHY|nr:uncharacterized protein FIBRA_00605 [Fibroporia radiculosa]CCL98603.1 predicted protein [Fibroporia radiculosa]